MASVKYDFTAYKGARKLDHIYKGGADTQIESVYKGNSLVWMDKIIQPTTELFKQGGKYSKTITLPMDGIILSAGWEGSYGSVGVSISHNGKSYTVYPAHDPNQITVFTKVRKGDSLTATTGGDGGGTIKIRYLGDKETIVKVANKIIVPAYYDEKTESWKSTGQGISWWQTAKLNNVKVFEKNGNLLASYPNSVWDEW